MRSRRWTFTLAIILAIGATGCRASDADAPASVSPSEESGPSSSPTTATSTSAVAPTTTTTTTSTTTTIPVVQPLSILVTNDDGIEADGIAAMVAALQGLADVEITVVAPAANQSGTSDTTSDGPVSASEATTANEVAGTAVDGTPADSVGFALGALDRAPDLVISGVNNGQNIGPFVELSGTVGAARTAARAGVPAIAVSAGLVGEGATPSYEQAAAYVVAFITEHRLDDGTLDLQVSVTSFNVPSCTDGGEIRGLVEVAVAPEFPDQADPFASDCLSEATAPTTDYGAVSTGYASVTDVGY